MFSKNQVDYRWVILALIAGSQLVLSMGSFGWGPLAPFLKKLMSLNSLQIGTVSASFYFASALSAFPAGIIVDRYGVKRGFVAWLGLTGFPLFFLGFFISFYYVFLIMVAVAGFGYGFGNPVASKGLYIWFDRKTRGMVFGIRQAAVTAGAAIAGVLLVYISQRSGPVIALRTVFCMISLMIVLVLVLYKTPEGAEHVPGRPERKGDSFIRSNLSEFFKNRVLFILSIVAAIFGMGQGVVATFFLLYLNEELGYSLLTSGYLFTLVMISGAVGRVFWGVVSDRLFKGSRRPVLIIISFLGFLSLTLLGLWPEMWPRWMFVLIAVGIGFSSWGWNGITFLMVAEISGKKRMATSVGLATTFGWFGISLGSMGFGIVTDHFGYFLAWMSQAVFCFLGFLLCFQVKEETSRP